MKDPIVEEVRMAREEHAKKFNYNLKEICRDLKEKQARSGHQIVNFPPHKHFKATGT